MALQLTRPSKSKTQRRLTNRAAEWSNNQNGALPPSTAGQLYIQQAYSKPIGKNGVGLP